MGEMGEIGGRYASLSLGKVAAASLFKPKVGEKGIKKKPRTSIFFGDREEKREINDCAGNRD